MPISIHLPDDVERRLDKLCALTGRNKSFYITQAVREHLDDIEDLYLANQRLSGIRSGSAKPVPLKDMLEKYDLED